MKSDIDEKTIFLLTAKHVENSEHRHPYDAAVKDIFGEKISSEEYHSCVALCRATYFMHRFGSGHDGYNRLLDSVKSGVKLNCDHYKEVPVTKLVDNFVAIKSDIIELDSCLTGLINILTMKGIITKDEIGRALFIELSRKVSALEAKLEATMIGRVYIP